MFLDKLVLPQRDEKPRRKGITSVHDVSLTIGELSNILDDYSPFIDVAKLGVGTAAVTIRLREKIAVYESHGVYVYFGGSLFEKFYFQNRLLEYEEVLKEHNISWIEISSGTLNIDIKERCELVNQFASSGFSVLAEVGCKDDDHIMPPSQWIGEIHSLLEAGSTYVITEGRNSGTAGLFRPSGEIRMGLLDDIVAQIDTSRIIFEAPTSKAQMYFINKIGSNVNLGNVNPNDLLLLETQRLGLRSETFFIE